MYQTIISSRRLQRARSLLIASAAIWLLVVFFSFVSASGHQSEPENVTETAFFSLNGAINPNASIAPTYFQSGGNNRQANFALAINSGVAPVTMEIRNSANVVIWSGSAISGEVVWGTVTLTPGSNRFTLRNLGDQAANFSLNFYDLPATPYQWQGQAAPNGFFSQARLIFPQSGLYTFNFGVNANGRYVFTLDDNYLQKTVTGNTTAVFYVSAGIHDMAILQSTSGGFVNWNVQVSYAGQPANSLPYEKSSDHILDEWLPIFLAAPAQANLALSASGAPDHSLNVNVYPGGTLPTLGNISQNVQTGETTWMTFNLPAGLSLIRLTAVGGFVSYTLALDAPPTTPFTWSGAASANGANSVARIVFPTSGLYAFDFSVNGRYQFLLQVDDNPFIQKTVENNSDDVVYYVPAGTHYLLLDQDSDGGATWDVAINLQSAGNNTLPYGKTGGHIGGAGNDFNQEWLPIALDAATTVNLSLDLDGAAADSLRLEVYKAGSNYPDFISPYFMGTEKGWITFDLSAGANRLRLLTSQNSGPLRYELEATAVPLASNFSWDGFSLANGANSTVMVNFPSSGLYRFSLDAADGFANLMLDDHMPSRANSATSYDVMVDAGWHEVYVVQDPAYPATDWATTIAAAAAGESFFVFEGILAPGESVTPLYTVPTGNLDFNFALAVSGADVDLTLTAGNSNVIWDSTAYVGETVWGTGTLTGQNSATLTNNDASNATISLVYYHIPSAGYDWDGLADASGENSHIRLIFPQSGLYTFDAGVDNGRYQFRLVTNTNHILKTAEADTSVTYYVPAGMHDLYLEQDSGAGADWDLSISEAGANADTLPYEKMGGEIGGAGNDFGDEWLPIHLGAAMPVNLSVSVIGDAADSLAVTVLSAAGDELDSVTVYGGETNWRTLDLSPDARVYLNAMGNAGPLSYDLDFHAIPEPDTAWAGVTAANGAPSHARVRFPESGLYDFDLGVGNGRYQLLLNEEFIQKTAEANTAVTYYVPAGVHDIFVRQDSGSGAAWNVAISGPIAAADTLPYAKMGGELGGAGNDFDQEWLPIHLGSATLANLSITLTGEADDAASLEVWDAMTRTMSLPAVYGTETVWSAVELPADARLFLLADSDNADVLSYEIAIHAIEMPTYAWSGLSLEEGLNSNVVVNLSLAGTYQLAVVMDEGFTNFDIDGYTPGRLMNSSAYTVTFSRPAGLYSFTSLQSAGYERTVWEATVSLLSAEAPTLTAITPDESNVGMATAVALSGTNFMSGLVVDLVQGNTTYALENLLVISTTQVLANVPATAPEGIYDVRLTNPDTQSATLVGGFTVFGAAPVVSGIAPDRVKVGSETPVTISGSSFMNGATAKLVQGANEYSLGDVVVVSAGQITAVVPATVLPGTYHVVVTNPNTQSGQLENGLTVEQYMLYLPLTLK